MVQQQQRSQVPGTLAAVRMDFGKLQRACGYSFWSAPFGSWRSIFAADCKERQCVQLLELPMEHSISHRHAQRGSP